MFEKYYTNNQITMTRNSVKLFFSKIDIADMHQTFCQSSFEIDI